MADGKGGKCHAVSRSGRPCGATVVAPSGMCAWHAPEWAERRREWSRKGGEGRSNKRRAAKQIAEPMTPAELQSLLGVVLRGVIAGRLEPGVANAAANLGRALVAVREATTLADEVAAIKEAIGLGSERTA